MDYIILNGKDSRTITGLLIQTLPPISKPLMRTEVEEIDGRDGDIITNLGYSAYDKVLEVGLHGNFDINEVIAYFDTAGIVIFSNEADKYYNYAIIEQIDFEKLLRFRTATVTLHCQPFKYSTTEQPINANEGQTLLFQYSQTTNGVTVSGNGGILTISGTATAATEFYVRLAEDLTLDAGNYKLTATTDGTGATACSIRLIYSTPINSDSFGSNYLALRNNTDNILTATLETQKTYKYLWFYITAGTAMNFTLTTGVYQSGNTSLTVTNAGNTAAKPIITIYGTGDISLYLNGYEIFDIALGDEGYITLDAIEMNAYKDGVLKNRLVTGDYDNLTLNVGANTISWSGNVTQITVENYSRWL